MDISQRLCSRCLTRRLQEQNIYIPKNFSRNSHVTILRDIIKKSLSSPYKILLVISRGKEKTFKIKRENKTDILSVDHLKPAYIEDEGYVFVSPVTYNEDLKSAEMKTQQQNLKKVRKDISSVQELKKEVLLNFNY